MTPENNGSSALVRPGPTSGALSASETALGERALTKTTAQTHAMAIRAEAEIKAQYTMALARPRDLDTVRLRLIGRCKATRFAEVARYKKPQGRKKNEETGQWETNFIEGWSIRFVEEAIRSSGNVRVETMVTADDADRRMVRVSVTDMEANIPYTAEITIAKTVERKELKKNQMPIAVRTNSYGEPLYILPATDDEVRMSEARLVSMAIRTLGLRLIPGDILDECLETVMATQRSDVEADPAAARKRLVDAFAGIGVQPVDIAEYLGGRPLDALTPDLVLELRGVYQLMRDEGLKWRDILASSAHVARDDDEPKNDGPSAKLRATIEAKAATIAEKDKAAATRRIAVMAIADKVRAPLRAVQTVLQLVHAGKSVAEITRSCQEQTGVEEEATIRLIVDEARAVGLLPPASSAESTEPPKTRGQKQKKARPIEDIAAEAGVSLDVATAIIAAHEQGQTVMDVLRAHGMNADEPTIALVLAALRK